MAGPTEASTSNPSQIVPQEIHNHVTIPAGDFQTLLATIKGDGKGGNEKDLRFQDQVPFTGKPEDLDNLLREAEIRFQVQEKIYNDPTKRAYYVLTLFKSGNAKLWKEQYIRQREGKTLCAGNDWQNFKRMLKDTFRDVGSKDDAIQQLGRITQNRNQPTDEYNTRFRILIQKAGLDEQDNAVLLIQYYIRGLNREIAKRIITNGAPNTLQAWMQSASLLDGYERRANAFFTNAITFPSRGNGRNGNQKGKSSWKPRLYTPKDDMGEPMEIDRLDPTEEKRRREKNLCFKCAEPGHQSRNCPNQERGHQGSSNRNTEQRNHQGKKRNFQGNRQGGKAKTQVRVVESEETEDKETKTERTRAAIRNIISKNFKDQESDDYLHFVEQVEQMGF